MAENLKQEITPEQREKLRKDGLRVINNDYLSGIALSNLAPQMYGQEIASSIYQTAIKNPDNKAYNDVLLPVLQDENGETSLTAPGFKKRTFELYVQALSSIKVKDVSKIFGIENNIKDNYSGKYVNELSEEDQKKIFSLIAEEKLGKIIADQVIPEKRKSVKSNLEKLLTNNSADDYAMAA